MTLSAARYVSEMAEPPGLSSGPNRCSMDTKEYDDADMAAR